MSLTYQPFAEIPDVDRLGNDLRMSVPDGERIASGFIGAGLAGASLARGGWSSWALLLAGGALVWRALTGRCPLYDLLDVDRRHSRTGVPALRKASQDTTAALARDIWEEEGRPEGKSAEHWQRAEERLRQQQPHQ